MKNELLKIGPLTLYGYGFMIAIGAVSYTHLTLKKTSPQKL